MRQNDCTATAPSGRLPVCDLCPCLLNEKLLTQRIFSSSSLARFQTSPTLTASKACLPITPPSLPTLPSHSPQRATTCLCCGMLTRCSSTQSRSGACTTRSGRHSPSSCQCAQWVREGVAGEGGRGGERERHRGVWGGRVMAASLAGRGTVWQGVQGRGPATVQRPSLSNTGRQCPALDI